MKTIHFEICKNKYVSLFEQKPYLPVVALCKTKQGSLTSMLSALQIKQCNKQ